MRIRYKVRRRLYATVTAALATFVAPLVLAIPMIAIVAVLHGWWSAVPLMHYWRAYGLGVVTIGLGGGSVLCMWLAIRSLLGRS